MGSINPPRPKPAEPQAGTTQSKRRCPICTAPTEPAFRPFCSRRCADVDLSRWLRGAYVIAGSVEADEDGDDTAAAAGTARTATPPDDEDTP